MFNNYSNTITLEYYKATHRYNYLGQGVRQVHTLTSAFAKFVASVFLHVK